jgi:hypothetical protein
MSISTQDFSGLSSGEIAELYQQTRKLYIAERDGVEEAENTRPKSARNSKAHIVHGAVCECSEGLASHFAADEKTYIHPDGFVATMQDGEEIPLTEEQRKIQFYESMPDSQVQALPKQDQDELYEWRDARIEQIAAEFKRARPLYYPESENLVTLLDYLAKEHLSSRVSDPDEADYYMDLLLQRGVWKVETLCEAFDKLYKAGQLETRPGVVKPLSASDLRKLSALASGCRSDHDYEHVLQKYLELSGIDESWKTAALDPVYSPIVEKAVFWIWEQAQETYTPTEERRAAIRKYLAGRFPTVKLLNAAWLSVQRQEELGQEGPPTPRLSPDEAKLQQARALADAIVQEQFRGI